MKKNRVLKIVAFVGALLIIGMIFTFFNAFMGNPISASIATSKIKAYVKETYSSDFEVEHAKYNFKNSDYFSFVQSKSSPDTRFPVSWRGGKIEDSYEYEVANCFTTYRRLSSEFNEITKKVLDREFEYKTDILFADLGKGEDFKTLQLDMKLDVSNPPIASSLTAYIISDDISDEFMADRLLELKSIMVRNNIHIDTYHVVLEEPNEDGLKPKVNGRKNYLREFPSDKIILEGLREEIKKYQQLSEDNSIKEDEKLLSDEIKNDIK